MKGMRKTFMFACLFVLVACGASRKVEMKFEQPVNGNRYTDTKNIEVKLSIEGAVDSVVLMLNNEHRILLQEYRANLTPQQTVLGENVLVAEAYKSGKKVAKKYLLFEIVTNHIPTIWKPKVLRKLKHEADAFTQGLFIHNEKLYETTGERGHSRLILRDLKDGNILKSVAIPAKYFGEGATVWNQKVYYITWTSGEGFIFDAEHLTKEGTFNYGKYTKEGWGLVAVEKSLVMSNGSDKLLFFHPENMQFYKSLNVVSNRGKQAQLNELEYDGHYIYANVWMTNEITVINPRSGRVEAIIDCTNLVRQEKRALQNPDSDVLNGIAYSARTQTFYLTGKNWEHIYEVKLLK